MKPLIKYKEQDVFKNATVSDVGDIDNLTTTEKGTLVDSINSLKLETDSKISAHTSNKSNPHAVTAEQVNAYEKTVTFTKTEIQDLLSSAIAQSKLDANPIGTVITTTNNANPSDYIGGTWERFAQGRTLVGVDESDEDFNSTGRTGGEKEHILTIDEMPSHSHQIGRWNPSGTGYDQSQRKLAAAPNNASGVSGAVETATNGGNKAHNNLQPYVTVYYWRRVA